MFKHFLSMLACFFCFSAQASDNSIESQAKLLLLEVEKHFIFGDLPNHELKITKAVPKASVQANTIYLNPDFIAGLSTEALAFVLAHEVAHTISHHSDKMAWFAIFRHGVLKFLAGKTEGLLASLSTDPKLLEMSRRQETQADAEAAKVLVKLGISPCSAFEEVILLVNHGVVSNEVVSTHGSNRVRLDAVCSFG